MGRGFFGGRVLALSCMLLVLSAPAALAAPLPPDLVADAPGAPLAPVVYDDGAGPRLLMRFDGFVHNAGQGALDIRADGRSGTTMTNVRQRIYDSGGGYADWVNNPTPQVLFETDDDHDHWHLKNIARYSLWNQDGTAEVAPAQKVGFCLVDSQRRETHGPGSAVYTENGNRFCEQSRPTAGSVTMGVSAGWRDVYHKYLAFQWIDVSDVAPGSYRLRAEIDPEGRILESNEVNPPALGAAAALVPGYRATNVDVAVATGPRQVQLSAVNVGGITRAPEFKIVSGPAHGSLDRPVGQWFTGGSVRYTPDPGPSDADSFTFAARDPGSSYPRNPPAAVATLPGGGETVVRIAGAPETLTTGASAQLSAVVENDLPEVTWSVDGVLGGNAASGTVSAGGLYRAPATVPPGGQVRVSAQSASGGSDEAVIRILATPEPRPAPDVPGPVPPPASQGPGPVSPPAGQGPGSVLGKSDKSNLISPLRFARHGKRLLVSLRSARSGLVVVRANTNGRRIGHCRARVAARQRMTCAIRLDRLRPRVAFLRRVPRTSRLRLPGMRVSAALYVKGDRRAVRRARVDN